MKQILSCRRTFISLVAILALLSLGLTKDADVAMAIASVAAAISAANAHQGSKRTSAMREVNEDGK